MTGFVLIYINAAAGIIGDGPIKLLYLGVLVVGFVGALIARFGAREMALALLAAAVARLLGTVLALVVWKAGWHDLLVDSRYPHPLFHPGVVPVFRLNAAFVALWIVPALLIGRDAARFIHDDYRLSSLISQVSAI